MSNKNNFKMAIQIFKENGGILKTSQAIKHGIYPRVFYDMNKKGIIEQVSRGLYKLTDLAQPSYPDLVTVAIKIPQGRICLISALVFHDITSQVSHDIYIALKAGARRPKLDYPPVKYFWFSEESFNSGVEIHKINGINISVYSPEKTVADCFKFRNRVGLDVAIEALKLCRVNRRSKISKIMEYAKICRVQRIMKPYIEAIL